MRALVLIVDGLSAGWLGTYGNEWTPTPHLDRFAAEAVVFDQHFADRPDPTGLSVALGCGRHAFPTESECDESSTRADLLCRLARHGIVTLSAFCDRCREPLRVALDRLADCEQGLLILRTYQLLPPWSIDPEHLDDAFADAEPIGPMKPEPWLRPEPGPLADDAVAAAIAFDCVQRTFSAAVTQFDDWFGRLWSDLRQRGLDHELLIVVTSGFGQALGEHGYIGPTEAGLFEEIIHLPLLMRLPQRASAGRRVEALTQSIDLMPTLLDTFGLPLPPSVHGHSVLPLTRGERPFSRPYVCLGWRVGRTTEWALRTADWYLRCPDTDEPPSLYRKPDDRWEVNDVSAHHLDWVETLTRTLRDYVHASGQSGPLVPPSLPTTPTDTPPNTGST